MHRATALRVRLNLGLPCGSFRSFLWEERELGVGVYCERASLVHSQRQDLTAGFQALFSALSIGLVGRSEGLPVYGGKPNSLAGGGVCART